jgi:hypothetical protein
MLSIATTAAASLRKEDCTLKTNTDTKVSLDRPVMQLASLQI